jgi:hypothetical protein
MARSVAGMETTTYPVQRLTFPIPSSYDAFVAAYEQAAPALPAERLAELVRAGTAWDDMERFMAGVATHGFVVYHRNDVTPLFSLAHDAARAIAYLMGNHMIAERMFRHEPRAMLYAPLRTLVWEDTEGCAWFSADRPSDHFASFGIEAVADVGRELDTKLYALLEVLGLDVR